MSALVGLPKFWVYRRFPNREEMLREVVLTLVGRAARIVDRVDATGNLSVAAAIADMADQLADAFGTREYREALQVVLRERAARPALVTIADARIYDRLIVKVGRTIVRIGRSRGLFLAIRTGGADRFVRFLECAFALPRIRGEALPMEADERRIFISTASAQLMGAIYAVDIQEVMDIATHAPGPRPSDGDECGEAAVIPSARRQAA